MKNTEGDVPRAPRYRFRAEPFGADPCATLVQIRRVDGDPDGGEFPFRTSSDGDLTDVLVGKLRDVLAKLKPADDMDAPR